jgi:hypothetical protein
MFLFNDKDSFVVFLIINFFILGNMPIFLLQNAVKVSDSCDNVIKSRFL